MISYEDELYHHGIKGQKWGVRRYQNADGSLTAAGEKRYGSDSSNSSAPFLRDKTRAIGKKVSNAGRKVAGGVDRAAEKVYNHRVARNERLRKAAAEYKEAHAKAQADKKAYLDAQELAATEYRNLARTELGRKVEIRKAIKGHGSEAANKYIADHDRGVELTEIANESYLNMVAKYGELGRTKLTRFIRYQTFKPRG